MSVRGQRVELNTAQAGYDKYETVRRQKSMEEAAKTTLLVAKAAIDKASSNEKTAGLPITFALKGAIYSSLALNETNESLSAQLCAVADETLAQAKEIDPKGENKKIIANGYLNLAQYHLNYGLKAFNSYNFDVAYQHFTYYKQVLPSDTNAIYYTGLAAAQAAQFNGRFYAPAIENYKKLLNSGFSKEAVIYLDISSLYISSKDTIGAEKVLNEGMRKFPADLKLFQRGVELALKSNQPEDIGSLADSAVTKMPNNKLIWYYTGLLHSKIADIAAAAQGKTKSVAANLSLQQKVNAQYKIAIFWYEKVLAADPNDYQANLNIGYVLTGLAIETYNTANLLPPKEQKEYLIAIDKANRQFDAAKPYLLKALKLNPNSRDALINLNIGYRAKRDKLNADDTTKKLAALKPSK
jgi:hypothetical protein